MLDPAQDSVVQIPAADPFLTPLLSVIPLQLLAYHIAALRGCDVDQPRNLAKSVTVEVEREHGRATSGREVQAVGVGPHGHLNRRKV